MPSVTHRPDRERAADYAALIRPTISSRLRAGPIRLSAGIRLAVVAPVSPGRRIVGAEAGAEHDQGPLARLLGCLGRLHRLGSLHRFTVLCRFAADSAFWLPGGGLLLQGGLRARPLVSPREGPASARQPPASRPGWPTSARRWQACRPWRLAEIFSSHPPRACPARSAGSLPRAPAAARRWRACRPQQAVSLRQPPQAVPARALRARCRRARIVRGRCLRERLRAYHHKQDTAKHAGARGDGGRESWISGEYLSAASFLGVAGLIAKYGADALWYPVGFTAGYLGLLLFVAAPLRRSGAYTVPTSRSSGSGRGGCARWP